MLRFMIQALKVAAIFALAITIVITGQRALTHYLDQASAENDTEQVVFTVETEESVESVSGRLQEQGLIRSSWYFEMRMRLSNTDSQLKAGQFTLNRGMTVPQVIEALTTSSTADVIDIRFQEGWRTEQYANRLAEVGMLESPDEFMDAIEAGQWNYEFLSSRPSEAQLEGYLFPDTYQFRSDATAEDVINTLLQTFELRLPDNAEERASELGYNLHNVITLASIIEREAMVEDERRVIASVFYNRLDESMPLQADPTVQYIAGTSDNWWPEVTQAHLDTNASHNTYLNPGIPPWPISNPSLAAIEAALNPADTDFIYFVTTNDGTGSHVFAETYEEHEDNIQEHHGQ